MEYTLQQFKIALENASFILDVPVRIMVIVHSYYFELPKGINGIQWLLNHTLILRATAFPDDLQ
jgi:hypothetical protein